MTPQEAIEHIQEYYNDHDQICMVLWTSDDVIHVAEQNGIDRLPDCTVSDILSHMENNHDGCNGITWNTIDSYINVV